MIKHHLSAPAWAAGVLLLAAAPVAAAFDAGEAERLQLEELRRQQQRQEWQRQQHSEAEAVRLEGRQEATVPLQLPLAESPCFAIERMVLTGDEAGRFDFALSRAVRQSGFRPGMCLGAQSINRIMTLAQNAVIDHGYTTTRILAAPQDLNGGVLSLSVIPGRIDRIRIEPIEGGPDRTGRIAAFRNEIPATSGSILNLRDLEQGLENFKRIPTAEADIQIVPGAAPDSSDVVVRWQQRLLPYRLSLSADDSGSRVTGKYQGGITFSADNPLGLSDLFYVSYHRDLGHKASHTDKDGIRTGSGTRSYALHYSVPFGRWLWAFNHQYYRYHQAVAGDSENYDYNGESSSSDLGLSRLFYRSARHKSSLHVKLWQRQSKSRINDAEIDVQRRRTAGWAAELEHKAYLGRGSAHVRLGYKRGTGGGRSLRAPEEVFGEGSSRMKIVSAQAGWRQPWVWGGQHFSYDGQIRAQWQRSPLTPQDRIAIGGRYTVRGFDGETTLAAERGWYARQDLAWHYHPAHQLYVGVDAGRVSGPSARYLLGQNLAGGVIGLKGQFKAGGQLDYDLFAGKPWHKPQYFRTARITLGFHLNYSF